MTAPAAAAPGPAPRAAPDPPERRVGLLGGTFDPPHVGHVVAAAWVRAALHLDEVRLVVAHRPWQKAGTRAVTPAADRLALVRAAVAGIEGIGASAVEIDRGGDSYTVDTLTALRAAEPGTDWFVLLGHDAAAGLPSWERWTELPALATFVVVERRLDQADPAPLAVPGFDFVAVDIPRLDISSTELRRRVAAGLPVDGLVPPAVSSAIAARALYREPDV